MELNNLFGLPAHPLMVHIPVVLTPLALVGVVAVVVNPRLSRSFAWWVAAALGISAVTSQLAVWSGGTLKDRLDPSELIERHAELARTTRTLTWVFLGLYLAYLIYSARQARSHIDSGGGRRTRAVTVGSAAVVVVIGLLATFWVVRTGHSGAKAVWVGTPTVAPQAHR